MTIEPDTKDWTWVLERPCDECGFDSAAFAAEQIPDLIGENARGWSQALASPDAAVRPVPHIWSTLEYACHVRDVHTVFAERVALMLDQDDPVFESWDQDAAAVEKAYRDQGASAVEVELVRAARVAADRYAAVGGEQWQRRGRRSNGSEFTVETLGRYHLHDVVHHLYDVGS